VYINTERSRIANPHRLADLSIASSSSYSQQQDLRRRYGKSQMMDDQLVLTALFYHRPIWYWLAFSDSPWFFQTLHYSSTCRNFLKVIRGVLSSFFLCWNEINVGLKPWTLLKHQDSVEFLSPPFPMKDITSDYVVYNIVGLVVKIRH
jgi:hypothetical protein